MVAASWVLGYLVIGVVFIAAMERSFGPLTDELIDEPLEARLGCMVIFWPAVAVTGIIMATVFLFGKAVKQLSLKETEDGGSNA